MLSGAGARPRALRAGGGGYVEVQTIKSGWDHIFAHWVKIGAQKYAVDPA
jgi:hypothetical protein